jgi:hypothetical protein
MASKQENYLMMHHPSLYKGMNKGGEVKKKKYYAKGGKNTDTVPAMLTPGEVVLNAEQQEALGKLVGMKPAALFEKIGIPGFAGGGMATKKDALVKYYENGGIAGTMKRVREDAEKAGHTETLWGTPKSKYISMETGSALVSDRFNIRDIVKTVDTDFLDIKKQRLQDDKKRRLTQQKRGY